MMCGKICSGKSTYAKEIKKENNAIILSCDDLMLALFDEQLGDMHASMLKKCQAYLYNLAEQIVATNVNVILEFGFWNKDERKDLRELFRLKNITTELHYIKVDQCSWLAQIEKRNREVKNGTEKGYYIDENMKQIFNKAFQPPDKNEIDVLVENSSASRLS